MAKKDKPNEGTPAVISQTLDDASLQIETVSALTKRVQELEASALEDHVVLDGIRYDIVDGPMRADMMLDAVKKGYVFGDRTAITISRHE